MPCKGFKIFWNREDILKIIPRFPKTKADYDIRLLEAETSYDIGLALDDWYALPVITREYMIATRLARKWLDALAAEEAINNAKSR